MGIKKKLIKSISFGKPGSRPRRIIEAFEKKHGKGKTSKMICELLVKSCSTAEEFKDSQKLLLIKEREDMTRQIGVLLKQRDKNGSELESHGIDPKEIDYKWSF